MAKTCIMPSHMATKKNGIRLDRTDYAGAVGFLAYSSSAIMTPICLLALMKELDFSLAGGGTIEAVRSLVVLAVLVASGFAAARWGLSASLAVGSLLLAVGMAAYAAAPAFAVVLSAMAAVGLGGGVIEALVTPLVQERHPADSGRHLNIVHAFWSIGVTVTVLVAGEMLTRGVSWRVLVAVSGGLAVIASILFLTAPRSAGATPPSRATTSDVWARMKKVMARGRFWIFAAALFFGGGAEATFTFWSASYVQLHFGAMPRAAGFATACFAAGMVAGRMLSGHLVSQSRLRMLIGLSAVAGTAVSLLVFVVGSLGGFYVLLVAAGLSVACFWPSIQAYSADCLDVDSTMLFILLACAGIPGYGFASWIMGIVGDAAGIRASFAVIPGFFAALLAILLLDAWRHPGRPEIRRPAAIG
jgi:fucose permease